MRINGEPGRNGKVCSYGGATVSCGSVVTIAGDGGDRAVRVDLPDDVVAGIRDIEVALPIHSQSLRGAELSGDGWPVVAAKACLAGSGKDRQGAVRIQLVDPVGARIGHEDVALSIDGDAPRFGAGYHR